MEILAEILFGLLEIVAEWALQLLFEALFAAGVRAFRAPFQDGNREPLHPVFTALGYTCYGAIAGGLSLLVFPSGFLHGEGWRMVNLVLTPVLAGGSMALFGAWRKRRGKLLVQLDRFGYGYIFALAMGAVRFAFAH
ncbi:MAG: hypothetical protein H7346_09225 [Burkholderiaceae bacterium]|nr:hypothetical protein [Burkholderiaceae bacterium]